MTDAEATATTIHSRLLEQHGHLEATLRGVAESIRADRHDAIHDDLAVFERQLLAHLNWEEMYLLPGYELRNPVVAASLRADHARFRALLGQLGIESDLHTLRADRFDEFAADLAAHAAREEEMYASAAASIDTAQREALKLRLQQFTF